MIIALLTTLFFITSCSPENETAAAIPTPPENPAEPPTAGNDDDTSSADGLFTERSTVAEVVSDPAFGDFGRLLFPADRNVPASMTLREVSSPGVYVWYTHIRAEKTVEIVNYLRDEALAGRRIFYRFYSDTEIVADPSKADTGLFFFRGGHGAPFAVTNAGGGFAYVGAMHDSFPHALEIARAGYNAFALIYRPEEPYEDLARAIAYIHDHAG